MQPIKSIEIYSEKLNYQNKEPGAWKVTESAKWISKQEAEITLNIDSIKKPISRKTDLLIVLDTSDSMIGNSLDDVKSSITKLAESYLNTDNRIGIVTFNSSSEIISNFTNNKSELIQQINSIQATGTTNYYKALVNIDEILTNYEYENSRECVVIFLADGYPNEDSPSEVGEFSYLKNKYPFLVVNAVQYHMGNKIVDQLKNISDNQYIVNFDDSFETILNEIATPSTLYDKFKITNYIDTDYFYIESENEIECNKGSIKFDQETQKIEWTVDNSKSGFKDKLTVKLKLKDNLESKIYPVTKSIEVSSKIENDSEATTSTSSPIISSEYSVTYDGNAPSGCILNSTPKDSKHIIFDTISINDEKQVCNGYQFNGWKIVTKDVKVVNKDYFIMPESDVEIKGVWSKVSIKKYTNGTIGEAHTLYKQIEQDMNDSSKYVKEYTGDTSTFIGNQKIYYYYGAAAYNHVLFANYCWRIVRTTDTGGVKLIYNGVPSSDGKCNNSGLSSQLTASHMNLTSNYATFNNKINSLTDVGYMYNGDARYEYTNKALSSVNDVLFGKSFTYKNGNYILSDTKFINNLKNEFQSNNNLLNYHHYTCFNNSDSCPILYYVYYISSDRGLYHINLNNGKSIETALEEMLYSNNVNKSSSKVKSVIDYWYSKNMVKYTDMLEDTFWCNDRNMNNQSTNGWNPNGGSMTTYLYFKTNSNMKNLTCENKMDRFTTSSENGNGRLTYPVGLITEQERGLSYDSNKSSLSSGNNFWSLSPNFYDFNGAGNFSVTSAGGLSANLNRDLLGVRPSVSIKTGTGYDSGDGSSNKPYVISQTDIFS